jgi:hypothetical protein
VPAPLRFQRPRPHRGNANDPGSGASVIRGKVPTDPVSVEPMTGQLPHAAVTPPSTDPVSVGAATDGLHARRWRPRFADWCRGAPSSRSVVGPTGTGPVETCASADSWLAFNRAPTDAGSVESRVRLLDSDCFTSQLPANKI